MTGLKLLGSGQHDCVGLSQPVTYTKVVICLVDLQTQFREITFLLTGS